MEEVPDIEELVSSYSTSSAEEKSYIENTVMEAYTPLVHKIANKYRNASRNGASDLQDRIQDGYQGLLQAIRSYNPDLDVKFITYAFGYVRKTIYFGIRNINCSAGSNAYTNSKLQKYRRIKKELSLRLGRVPSARELSLQTGWKINIILVYERFLKDEVILEVSEQQTIDI